jgi:hypothetical protein
MPELHLAAASILLPRLGTVAAERMAGVLSESLSLLFTGELFDGIATDSLFEKAEKKPREDACLAFV